MVNSAYAFYPEPLPLATFFVRSPRICSHLRMKALVLLLISLLVHRTSAVPVGFVDEGVATLNAISAAFAPNPRKNGKPMLLVAAKEGTVVVLEDPDNSDTSMQVFNLGPNLCTNGPRGLMTILPHPDFLTTGYLFIYYVRQVPNCPEDAVLGPRNRLSRFSMNLSTLKVDGNSEIVLLETSPSEHILHDGGGIVIGNDRMIYLSIGEGGNRENGPNLRTLKGKVVRLTLTGNVPPNNPFTPISGGTGVNCRWNDGVPPRSTGPKSVCEEIFSYGVRNPFRLSLDPNTASGKVRFAIGDVGASDWEELDYGGTAYSGTNYGWYTFEGPCTKGDRKDCPGQGPGSTEPFYYWQHQPGIEGGCITGSAFVPTGLWPSNFKFLYADFVFGYIYNLVDDPARACRACKPPLPAFRNATFHRAKKVVDMFFGPYQSTQALYYVTKDVGVNIRRIRASNNSDRAPKAVITVSKTEAPVNNPIQFFGSSSSDPNGDRLTYLWNFGDGRTSTEVNPVRSYPSLGQYQVTLRVTDPSGQSSQAFITIVVGKKPQVTMISPKATGKFIVGQRLRLNGAAVDAANKTIPPSRIFWEVQIRHATHYHPFLDKIAGNDFDLFPAPGPEELDAALNSYLFVSMTAVDANGVSATITRKILPKMVTIDLNTKPSGLKIVADYATLTTPVTITSWENHKLRLTANNQGAKVFSSWSIGGGSTTYYTVPSSTTPNPKVTATFV
jgi:glucose/arabinose dehydrogenase/PKD repeat protein